MEAKFPRTFVDQSFTFELDPYLISGDFYFENLKHCWSGCNTEIFW